MKKRPVKTLTAITAWLALVVMILWIVSMACITNAVAQQNAQLMNFHADGFTDTMADLVDDYVSGSEGALHYAMLDAVSYAEDASFYTSSLGENDSWNVLRSVDIPIERTVVFLDKEGNVVQQSGDRIFFSYANQEAWDAGQEDTHREGFAWIDLTGEESLYQRFYVMYYGTKSLYDVSVMRITGYFEGSRLIPLKLDFVTDTQVHQAVEKTEPTFRGYDEYGQYTVEYQYTVSGLMRQGLLEWQNQFDRLSESEGRDLETVYAINPQIGIYKEEPLEFMGKEYSSARELLTSFAGEDASGYMYLYSDHELNRAVILDSHWFWKSEDRVDYPDYVMVTAVVGYPLKWALHSLTWVYLVTFMICAGLVLILRRIVRRNMTDPMESVIAAMEDGWHTPNFWAREPEWQEPARLAMCCRDGRDQMAKNKNEIIRLNAALTFAREAEENRRRLVSGVAHELKTPLAVVHSYAEGLQERIAEEKREKYLETILSETERMDKLVLEMLDLSRLEAGKVKLARDTFDLNDLIRSVFEKLEALAEEKQLQITWDLGENCTVSADEARLTQAVTNFAANAVQYTPVGGNIHVRTHKEWGKVIFSVANDSERFTEEELEQVWESFYRRDKSRNRRGTGLGLAVTKQIVELHGGTCRVRNTETGVEFTMRLPG